MEKRRANITPESIGMDEKPSVATYGKFVFNEKNYLNTNLAKGENKKELRIRLLPIDKDSDTPFKTIYSHKVTVPPEVSPKTPWKSYVCLSKTEDINHEVLGDKCPFCEMRQTAYKKRDEARKAGDKTEAQRWDEIAKKYWPNEECIMRVIERGAEDDGDKFWKTSVRSDKKDPKHQIKTLFRDRWNESIEEAKNDNGGELPEDFVPENILDVETGKDLKITVSRVFTKDGKPTDKKTISVVDYGKNRPLSNDPELMDKWINDDKLWTDVFVAKPYDYLSLILDGEVPFYDKEQGKWVPKMKKHSDEEDSEAENDKKAADRKIEEAKRKAMSVDDDEEYGDDSDDDEYEEPEEEKEPEELPF